MERSKTRAFTAAIAPALALAGVLVAGHLSTPNAAVKGAATAHNASLPAFAQPALAASEGLALPSVAYRSYPSVASLAEAVGPAYAPLDRAEGAPLITLERWPEGEDQPSTLSMPGFGIQWLRGERGMEVAIWGSAADHHSVITLAVQPTAEEKVQEEPCGTPQA